MWSHLVLFNSVYYSIQRLPQAFPRDSAVKIQPAMEGTQTQPLGREGPLEEEVATHSSILAWDIPWTEEPGGLQSMRLQNSRTRLRD